VIRTLRPWKAAVWNDAYASERMKGDFFYELGKAYVRSGDPDMGLLLLRWAYTARSAQIAKNPAGFVNTYANVARAARFWVSTKKRRSIGLSCGNS
jgi:hypothetical protein